MKKGFLFTTDAILASGIFGLLMVVFVTVPPFRIDQESTLLGTAKYLASVLEKDGTFAGGDFLDIKKKLNALSPVCSDVSIEYYNKQTLAKEKEIYVRRPFCRDVFEKTTVLRTFVTFDRNETIGNTTIQVPGYYGVAKVGAWFE